MAVELLTAPAGRIQLHRDVPALVLAPMEGITDAPMRRLMGGMGAFTYAVSEFLRVSADPIPTKVFLREVPELAEGGHTATGLPVQVQLLGGHPERLAISAVAACKAGAAAIDINFGCPAPTVNKHDGGASLLKEPARIREIVQAVRGAVPPEIPVSAKLRLGWETTDAIFENAAMAAEGGASWLTIHARTRMQGYAPPVFRQPIAEVRSQLGIPVMANGDIWTLDDFRRCRDETGCCHFMIGRGALANPNLPGQIARELRLEGPYRVCTGEPDWPLLARTLAGCDPPFDARLSSWMVAKLKQWFKIAWKHGDFRHFDAIKQAHTLDELLRCLDAATHASP